MRGADRWAAAKERGGIFLRYGTRMRGTSIGLTVLPPALLGGLLAFKGAPPAVSLGVAGVFALMGVAAMVEAFGVQILVQRAGLVRRSPWAGLLTMQWNDVTRIRWIESMRWFEVTARDGSRIRASLMLDALGWFAAVAADETKLDAVADPPTREIINAIRASLQRALKEDPEWSRSTPRSSDLPSRSDQNA